MIQRKIRNIVLFSLLVGVVAASADTINGINMDFVPIGGIDNLADTDANANRNGYGAVSYYYRIGQREVTYAQFVASGLGSGSENVWVSPVGSSNAPVARINYVEAAQYCNWLTSGNANIGAYSISGSTVTVTPHSGTAMNALVAIHGQVYVMPTEDEWYKAAYYNVSSGTYSLYANGSGNAPIANTNSCYGNGPAYTDGMPWIVGSGTAEQNGTYDMMGNVFEQTETLDGGEVVYRGGGYWQDESHLQSTWRTTDLQDPSPDYSTVGMRIVAIPEPGTISLMSLSTISLFLTRTVRRRKRLGHSLMPVRRPAACDVFSNESDWVLAAGEAERDQLPMWLDVLKEKGQIVWSVVYRSYKSIDKAFWNRMVVLHEHRVARRALFRKNLRKKVLDCFDAFLSLIIR